MAQVSLDSGGTLQVHDSLYEFVRDEVAEGAGRTADEVFRILGDLVEQFDPRNRELLARREEVQRRIDDYYREKRGGGWQPTPESAAQDAADLERFLVDIGYLQPSGAVDFKMTTPQLDAEMDLNGPELVTPVTNASMAVGGANARWGSLYDAYFLSDVHPEIDRDAQRPARLRMVVEETNAFLDEHVAQWAGGVRFDDVTRYSVARGAGGRYELVAHTRDEREARLQQPGLFVGFNLGEDGQLGDFYLADNGLRIQIQLYEGGAVDPVNGQFRDLVVESALTNIIDFEDAVTVVDAEDQTAALRNYLGIIRGDLQAYGSRGNLKTINSDRTMTDPDGNAQTLKGTCLMSVRNVSLHMYTNAVTLNGEEVSERMVGLLLTTLMATAFDKGSNGEDRAAAQGSGKMPVRGPNSSRGFVYQVTPKLQTAEEVAEQVRLFAAIEERLGLASGTILIGIMNEELGMTLQLADALRASQSRAFFINTGFLDRTGAQIRAQMHAGPVDVRDDLTQAAFNTNYERHNVDVGIQTGIHKQGKIGKGMQVRNRAMEEMLRVKINHPRTGGNTAWVPAPYPSDLHSMHYHMVDVDEVQSAMEDAPALNIGRDTLLTFPVLDASKLSNPEVKDSLVLRYVHSMMAYAEPWVNRGIGCSGVPNFDGVEEMKDRATERIDSTVLANWRLHEVISQDDIERAVVRVAEILDEANASVEGYEPLADTPEKRAGLLSSPAIVSVLEVIDEAASSPSAFVEPGLFRHRRAVKASGG